MILAHNGTMDLDLLKRETAIDHERVEGSMKVMEPGLDRCGYIDILRSLYGFIRGWELWAGGVSHIELRGELEVRKRSPLLASDLTFFSSQLPNTLYPGPNLSHDNKAEVLGAMYVIEGSTLGGQYIARHLEETLLLSRYQGDAYFQGYGERTGAMWREMKEHIQRVPDRDSDAVIFAAKTLFTDFASWNESFAITNSQGRKNV